MRPLEGEEIEATLTRNGVGVLSLVDGDRPYGIPISFGYGAGAVSVLMQQEAAGESRKRAIMATNPRACLTVFEHRTEPAETWRSVVVEGELHDIPDGEEAQAFASLADNARFAPDYDVLEVPRDALDLHFVGLEIESMSGREFSEAALPADG